MLMQILLYSILSASTYLLFAYSFWLLYSFRRALYFTHAITITAGAYFAYTFIMLIRLYPLLSILFATMLAAVLGAIIDGLIYKPLRKRECSTLVLLLVSLGVYVLIQNLIQIIYGAQILTMRTAAVREGYNFLGARITGIQIATICVSFFLVIILSMFLKNTKIGNAMRAVANDAELADISGVNSDRVILWAFAIGSGLAGLAGILVALDVDMTPTMGMHALMMGVVVVIIGGVNSIGGIALGALLLATAQHLGAWFVGSEWQDTIAFVILVLFLLLRPQGFFGKKVRSATV